MYRELHAMKYLSLFGIAVFYVTEWCLAGIAHGSTFTMELLDKDKFLFTRTTTDNVMYYYEDMFLTDDRFDELIQVVIGEMSRG